MYTNEILLKPFYFIRHGQTQWNSEGRLMGQTDIPLNDNGVEQAHKIGKNLIGLNIETIITSPLKRAYETATIFNSYLQLPLVVNNNLKECCWGRLEGKLKENYILDELLYQSDRDGENYQEFKERIVDGINSILQNYNNVLIVSHGGVYKILMDVLNLSNQRTDNCVPYFFTPLASNINRWACTAI